MEHREQGQCVLSYQPTVKGKHQLHIKADGQHIRGSPFSVTVKLPVEKLGTPILTLSNRGGPVGVAVNGKGEVDVTEYGACCVLVFSPRGEKLQSFGTRGCGEGQFDSPCGVAVDGEGNLLVVDRGQSSYSCRNTHQMAISCTLGRGYGDPSDIAAGIAYSTSNAKVYVADTFNDHIQVLNSDLSSINTFGKRGWQRRVTLIALMV